MPSISTHQAPTIHRDSQHRRSFHTSQPSYATVLPTADTLTGGPILDIFDAPIRLGESRLSRDRPVPRTNNVRAMGPRPHLSPPPLPAPILFDGPARPHNLPLELQLKQAYRLNPHSHPSHRQLKPTFIPSQPLVELFDGPARITRCSSPPVKHVSAAPSLFQLN